MYKQITLSLCHNLISVVNFYYNIFLGLCSPRRDARKCLFESYERSVPSLHSREMQQVVNPSFKERSPRTSLRIYCLIRYYSQSDTVYISYYAYRLLRREERELCLTAWLVADMRQICHGFAPLTALTSTAFTIATR